MWRTSLQRKDWPSEKQLGLEMEDWPSEKGLHSEKFVMNEEMDSLLSEKVSNLLLT